MKIKIKDEMDKIKLTVTHQELVLLQQALFKARRPLLDPIEVEYLNDNLFDKDEFDTSNEVDDVLHSMQHKIDDVLDDILVW